MSSSSVSSTASTDELYSGSHALRIFCQVNQHKFDDKLRIILSSVSRYFRRLLWTKRLAELGRENHDRYLCIGWLYALANLGSEDQDYSHVIQILKMGDHDTSIPVLDMQAQHEHVQKHRRRNDERYYYEDGRLDHSGDSDDDYAPYRREARWYEDEPEDMVDREIRNEDADHGIGNGFNQFLFRGHVQLDYFREQYHQQIRHPDESSSSSEEEWEHNFWEDDNNRNVEGEPEVVDARFAQFGIDPDDLPDLLDDAPYSPPVNLAFPLPCECFRCKKFDLRKTMNMIDGFKENLSEQGYEWDIHDDFSVEIYFVWEAPPGDDEEIDYAEELALQYPERIDWGEPRAITCF